MSNVNIKITALGDFSQLEGQIKRFHASVASLNATLANTNSKLSASQIRDLTSAIDSSITATKLFTIKTVSLATAAENLGQRIGKSKTTFSDFKNALSNVNKEYNIFNQLGQRNVAMTRANVIEVEGMAKVYAAHNVDLKNTAIRHEVISQALKAQNAVLTQQATKMINWGKNVQWAGRQITAGLVMPLAMAGSQVGKIFLDVDKNLTNLAKVYGVGLEKPSQAALNKVKKDVLSLSKELGSSLGVSASEVSDIAAQFAAAGLTAKDNQLIKATKQASRMIVLGEADKQGAIKATIALQTAYGLSMDQVTEATNFFNAAQAATSTSMSDLIEAVPRVGPVIKGLGGSYKDMVAILTAMKEGGVPAGEAANAIKTSLGRLINPTAAASKRLKEFGVDINGIVKGNAGNLIGMITELQTQLDKLPSQKRQQAIAELFGKFQFARMAALMDNFGKENTQSFKILDMYATENAKSAADLAAIADEQTRKIQQSASGKFKIALESLKNSLLPLGQMALSIFTSLLEKIEKFVEFLSGAPDVVKKFAKGAAILAMFTGPLVMIAGLVGNLLGVFGQFAIKIRMAILAIINGQNPLKVAFQRFSLLSEEELIASRSSEIFKNQTDKTIDSITAMSRAIEEQIAIIENYQNSLGGLGIGNVINSSSTVSAAQIQSMSDEELRNLVVSKMGATGKIRSDNSGHKLTRTNASNAILTGDLSVEGPNGFINLKSHATSLNQALTSSGNTAFNPSGKEFSSFFKDGKLDFSVLPKDVAKQMSDRFELVKKEFSGLGLSTAKLVDITDIMVPTLKNSLKLELQKAMAEKLILAGDEDYLNRIKTLDRLMKDESVSIQEKSNAEKAHAEYLKKRISQDAELNALMPRGNQSEATLRANYDMVEQIKARSFAEAATTGSTKTFNTYQKRLALAIQNTIFNVKGYSKKLNEGQHHLVATSDATNGFINGITEWTKSIFKAKDKTDEVVAATEKLIVAEVQDTAALQADSAAHSEDAAVTKAGAFAKIKESFITSKGDSTGIGGGLRGLRGALKASSGLKFGVGMGISIGGSMLSNAMPEGATGKKALSMASQGAGMGMIFGPDGALIGAALGALAGRFMELRTRAEEVAAGLKSTLGASMQEFDALGVKIEPLTGSLPSLSESVTQAGTAIDEFRKSIREASSTSEQKQFVEKLKGAGSDQIKIDELISQKLRSLALGGANKDQLEIAKVAYMQEAKVTRTNFDVNTLFDKSGKLISGVASDAISAALRSQGINAADKYKSATVSTDSSGFTNIDYGTTKQVGNAAQALQTPLQGLISLNTPLQTLLDTVNSLGSETFNTSTAGGQALQQALGNVVANDPQLKELYNTMVSGGRSSQDIMIALRAAIEGVGGSINSLPSMKIIDIELQLRQKDQSAKTSGIIGSTVARLAANAAKSSGGSSGSSGSGGSRSNDKQKKALQDKIDAIKKEEDARKKLLDLEKKELDYEKEKLSLQNQIREALASGNLLKAAELKQAMVIADANNAANGEDPAGTAADKKIAALQKKIDALQSKSGSSGGSGGSGGGSIGGKTLTDTDFENYIKSQQEVIDNNSVLLQTWKDFRNSPSVIAFKKGLEEMGMSAKDAEEIIKSSWTNYSPPETLISGLNTFKDNFTANLVILKNSLTDPKTGLMGAKNAETFKENARIVAAQTMSQLKDGLTKEKLKVPLEIDPKLVNNTIKFDSSGKSKNIIKMLLRASGGYISGPGTGTSDSIPAMLSNGEYVISASAVGKYGIGMLNSINAKKFSNGGYVVPNAPHMAKGGAVSTSNITATFNITGDNPREIAQEVMKQMEMINKRVGSVTRIG